MTDDPQELERSVRRLRQKLDRAEINLRRLEDQREGSAVLHAAVVREIEAKNYELERMTRRLEASEQLATQASRAKSTFLANMSHELRTPLNAIIGYAELLEEMLSEREVALGEHELGRIRRSGRNLLELIDQILDLSKIEAGRMQLDYSEVVLRDELDWLLETMGPEARRKGLELRGRVDVETPLRTDGQKLSQVLLNLLSNALKFTDRGWVAVEIADRRAEVQFSVEDTGVGMTPEQQTRVFQAFEQADPSTTRRFGGTGLGLAISERFCALLGGKLRVDSDLGRGTRFWFSLPRPEALREAEAVPLEAQ